MRVNCGFEWHVQLDTGKLFCRCESRMHDDDNFKEIKRILKPSFGESGKVDVSAAFEGQKYKKIVYRFFKDTNCLVDLDEEPPHDLDNDALRTAVYMANALGSDIFKNLIFMRKTIVDGSNTTGFQRTGIIGLNGDFKCGDRTIPISTISLEEDSARKISESESEIIYNIDRLGIPLVEIATGVFEADENEAKEIAMEFGKFTRLFRVRRGIGTIRQDVNLSIEGGSRVELKGFQNIREMDKVISNEAQRQKTLGEIQKEKGYLVDNLEDLEFTDVVGLLIHSQSKLVGNALAKNKAISAMRLEGFSGLFGKYVCENKRFGGEVSDYLKVKLGYGIVHSDELPAYGISEDEKAAISEKLGCKEKDAFVMSIHDAGRENDIISAIAERVKSLLEKVPSEVRLVQDDNTTKFLRPMGGEHRMYVETDLPILQIPDEMMKEAADYKGLTVDVIKEKYGLNDEAIDKLISINKLQDGIKLNKKLGLGFNIIVGVMVEDVRYIKRKFGFNVNGLEIEYILERIADNTIAKDSPRFIMELMALGKASGAKDAIEKYHLNKMNRKDLEAGIRDLIKTANITRPDTIITNLRDRLGHSFDAGEAYELLTEILKNG